MWGLDEIKDYLRSNLKPARYGHVLGVVNTAIKLAETYGEDKEKAEIAALCHDVAKNMSNEELRKIIEERTDVTLPSENKKIRNKNGGIKK